MRTLGGPLRVRVLGCVAAGSLVLTAALAVTSAGAKGKKPKLPNVIFIRFQLSESFTHVQPGQTWTSSATIDEVQEETVTDLKHDTIIHALRLRSSSFKAETASGTMTCEWRGRLASGAAPEIVLRHRHHRTYGMVPWPDQAGSAWQQKLTSGPSSCPSQASFSPVQDPNPTSSPSLSGFTAMERFYDAIFPTTVPKGERKIKVSMSGSGNIPGETDDTRANGLVTISYGRCPSPLKRCKPTNGR